MLADIVRKLPEPVKRVGKYVLMSSEQFLGKNYVAFMYSGDEYRVYYTPTTRVMVRDLIEDEYVVEETVPLGVLEASQAIDVVIDIGAHFGDYSVLLKLLNPEADLIAFEPDDYNRKVLSEFLSENSIDGIVSNKIVARDTGLTTFYVDETPGSVRHSTSPSSTTPETFTPVEKPTIAISDVIRNNGIDRLFIKIDAEGEEDGILRDLLATQVSVLEGIVELHPVG